MKPIKTNYDLAAVVDSQGLELVAIPVYEDNIIRVFELPSGGVQEVQGISTLPEDAREVDIWFWNTALDDCENAEAVFEKCESLLWG